MDDIISDGGYEQKGTARCPLTPRSWRHWRGSDPAFALEINLNDGPSKYNYYAIVSYIEVAHGGISWLDAVCLVLPPEMC